MWEPIWSRWLSGPSRIRRSAPFSRTFPPLSALDDETVDRLIEVGRRLLREVAGLSALLLAELAPQVDPERGITERSGWN